MSLVLFQGDIVGFSVPVVFRSKTQFAGNGPVLVKHCNAAAGHHRNARRVGLSASMAVFHLGNCSCVTLPSPVHGLVLQRTMAIRFEARLALNADRPTEPDNITLKEYSRIPLGTTPCLSIQKSFYET